MPIRFVFVIFTCCVATAIAGAETEGPTFESRIKPLFAAKCGKCHRDQERKGALDLSSMQGIHNGGETGDSLLADSLDDSALWHQVDSGEMPPEGEPPLSQQERQLIRDWIASGAPSMATVAKIRDLNLHDVLPILLLRCNACHGPRLQEGGLDLRTRAAMTKGGRNGPAFSPGNPDDSLMIQRIETEACPPSESLLKFFVRRPAATEVKLLRDWIAAGAPEGEVQPDVATTSPDPLVNASDREHWSFQAPAWPEAGRSLDDFVGQQLVDAGLTWSDQADRFTLIRRVHYDLLGVPPELEELQRWSQSDDPQWYARMVDHVLASPRYGERWGRYWLDLAGYADSEGGISADPIRPVAWKYRDYVIAALNEDKPYDEFLIEQLAGDELLGVENSASVTDEQVNHLVATGFLRMGIDETGSRTMNFVPERLKVIGDALSVVSSGIMGLTMECARCHSHKYDPIPQRDYYRLKAVFQGALDEHDWSSFKQRNLDVATEQHRARVAQINPPLEKQIKVLLALEKKTDNEIRLNLLRHHYPDQSDADNQTTLRALRIADNNRTLPERMLVERLQKAELLADSIQPNSVLRGRKEVEQIKAQLHRLRQQMVAPLTIRALWDLGRPSPTYILRRGEHDKPGSLVGPGVPAVLTDGKTPFEVTPVALTQQAGGRTTTGRRLAFARWLTRDDHPLTARVMVNRIFARHFGAGLVTELGNFGRQVDPPSHPELLDWLALKFVQSDWSIKAMHRLMMNSRTYRQSSRVTDDHQRMDPQNRLLGRMPLQRMDAEALRDSLLLISGNLASVPGGIPDAVSVNRDGLVSVYPSHGGGWRRSVYLQYRRTEIPTMMDTFDYPQMGPNCIDRAVSTVSPQALMLMNDRHVHELAESFASRVLGMIERQNLVDDNRTRVNLVYRMALSRPPSPEELELGSRMLDKLDTDWQGKPTQALGTYCHTIFNSASFIYVD